MRYRDDDFEEEEAHIAGEPVAGQRLLAEKMAKDETDDTLAAAIRSTVETLNIQLLAAAQRRLDIDIGTGRWKKAGRVGHPTPRTVRVAKITKEL